MLTARYDPDQQDAPVIVTDGERAYQLTLDQAERLANRLDEALAWAGRPAIGQPGGSLGTYRSAQQAQ